MRASKIITVGLLMVITTILNCTKPASAAVEIHQLYQAQVAVENQATDERNQALRQALAQTLLKVSGDDAVLEHEQVQSALRNVRNYVVQFGYRQLTDELVLWVQFDQAQIDQIIHDAGSGVWSSRRPELLFWLVAEDEQLRRHILGSADGSPVVEALRETAEQRGLPIKLPLLDLNDSMTIGVVDLWARFDDRIAFASTRYDADGIVVARIYQTDPAYYDQPWMLDWTLQLGSGLRWRGEVTADTSADLGRLLINQVTQRISQRFRIGSQTEMAGTWRVQIQNLTQVTDVIQAEQLLQNMPSVHRVQLVSYGQQIATFELFIQTDPAQIMQALDLNQLLTPMNPEQRSEFEMPVYRWSQS